MKKSSLTFYLIANLVFILPVLADTTPIKVIARAPIEQIGTEGSVSAVDMATPNTLYTLVRYVPVGINGTPQVILADPQGQQYRIELRATDYSPPPAAPATNMVTTPSAAIPSPVTATNASPQPTAPIMPSPNVDASADNIARCPGAYSYRAPAGWKIKSGQDYTTVCDMRGENDCVAMITSVLVQETYFTNRNDPSLNKFAQDSLDMDKKMNSVPSAHETIQTGDLQPYTTTSGWEGLKAVMTLTTNGDSNQRMYHFYYFFAGHDDTKIMVEASCHGEGIDHYTPIFEDAIKTLFQE